MGNFLGELKRRKVLRVGAAYVVSSWVLLQVADLLTDILELPEWAPKLVFLILIVGFIPALILSWAFDVTPDGVQGEGGESGKGPIVVSVLLVVAGLAAGGWWYSGKDVRWARDTAIPEIESRLEAGDAEAAYSIATRVETTIPGSCPPSPDTLPRGCARDQARAFRDPPRGETPARSRSGTPPGAS